MHLTNIQQQENHQKKLYKSIYTKLKINKSKFRVASIGGNIFLF